MGQHRPIVKGLFSLLLVLIVAGALYSGYFFLRTIRQLTALSSSLPFHEPVALAEGEASNPQNIPEPVRGPEVVQELVENEERVNILLLGIDQREIEDRGPWRTDTMILVSLDPATHSAVMLSIPRDLWVTIPGYGENRINFAHYIGDAENYPGGGPALAKKTVWYLLGIPVHNYVRINFKGFEQIIDAIGGLTINVERPIHDEKYPDGHYGTMVIDIPAGEQHMDGKTALQYARSRHGTSDFDRMRRQQQVLLAARDKVMRLDIPISRIPQMLALVGNAVQTDLTVDEILMLAEEAKKVKRENIRHAVIDDSMTTTVVTPQGWMVEVPDWDKIRQLVDELFPAPQLAAEPSPALIQAQLMSEGARITVQNGTLTDGLARSVAEWLRQQGLDVVDYGNAERFDYQQTLIVVYTDKPQTVRFLAEKLQIDETQIVRQPSPSPDADISIILGRDYASRASPSSQ